VTGCLHVALSIASFSREVYFFSFICAYIGDTATASVSVFAGINTTEAGGTGVFSIVLDSQPSASVTIDASSTDAGEGLVSPWSLTFAVGQWNISQTVTVTGRDDVWVDGDIVYNITTGAASSSDTNFNGVSIADVLGVDNFDGTPLRLCSVYFKIHVST
jgi:hypothetical protein